MQNTQEPEIQGKSPFLLWPRLTLGFVIVLVFAILYFVQGGEGGGVDGFLASGMLFGTLTLGAIGAAVGTAIGACRNSFQNRALSALSGFATGLIIGAAIGAFAGNMYNRMQLDQVLRSWDKGNAATSLDSLKDNYEKYVSSQGLGSHKNVLKYVEDARWFYDQNQAKLKLAQTATDMQNTYQYQVPGGWGGRFTLEGRVLSFWYK